MEQRAGLDTLDEKHQSPDLSSIIQEIVNRSGWASGNNMVIIVTGTGTRTAESYDGEVPAAPLLVVSYSTPTLSSAANQSFLVGSSPTAISTITVSDDATTGVITASNDIRIKIPSGFSMTWDNTDTTATIGGAAAAKVSTTVSYEDSNQTLVLNVTSDFAAADAITVSDLWFKNFSSVSAADNLELEVRNDGITQAFDDKTITITGPTMSSAANRSFMVGDPTTAISTITVTDEATTPAITAANDIRIKIPSSFNMKWDDTDTTATIGGGAAAKVSTSVSYEDLNKTLVLDVTSNFAAADSITVSGLSFKSFSAVSSADNLELEVANDGSTVALDDKTITITDTIGIRVTVGNDDAEENTGTGAVNRTSADLELTTDTGVVQQVGMRFLSVPIPQGAAITSAYVEFETDETGSTTTNLTFNGEAADSAAAFTSGAYNISSRTKTTASVAWNSVPAWSTLGEKHQSPDLTSIVQEIVNRSGWASGNNIVMIVTGTGTRTAEAYEVDVNGAPLLVVGFLRLYISSAGNQTFGTGMATTPISTITVRDDGGVFVTAANDIRIKIPPSFNMTWDVTDTTATIGGAAAAKVSTTVSYEDSNKTLVLNVTSDFAAGDAITVSGLSFNNFSAASSADNLELEVRNDGTTQAYDSKTVTIVDYLTWDGGGADNNWNTAANWTLDVVPGATNRAIFNATSTKACTINANASVAGLDIQAGYTSTITQAAGVRVETGSGGFAQAVGTFTGGNSRVDVGGPFTLSGGTFTSTSSVLSVEGAFLKSGGTFSHGSGTLELRTVTDQSVSTGLAVLNHVTVGEGVVGYWKLDDGSGTSAADASGNGYTGTLTNGPTWSATVPSVSFTDSYSVDFNGSNHFVSLGNPALFPSGTAARSMCAWARTDTTGAGYRWVAAYGSAAGGQAMFLGLNGTTLYGGGYADDLTSAGFWAVGVWKHVCLTYDGTTARLYGNGSLLTSGAKNWNLVKNVTFIGRQVNYAEYWDGLIDEVRVYDRALSATEVSVLAGGGYGFGKRTLGGALDVNGDMTVKSLGEVDVSASNYGVNVAGSLAVNATGVFTPRSGTVTLDGTVSGKTLRSSGQSFNHLTVNGSGGSWQQPDALDVNGDLTITAGTLDSNGQNVSVAGNWSNAGTYTSGANTVTLDGTGAATVTTGGTGTGQDFNNLTISKGAGATTVTLQTNDLDVDGTITVTTGTLVQGALNVTAGA
ncbi:MAG: LamG domain-containing protein, partial [Nitrospirae bacterium]|nr:LamG domain-containing protein [Nitrospirota bacterium]